MKIFVPLTVTSALSGFLVAISMQGGMAMGVAQQHEPISIVDFGAVSNGTDSTAAIKAAITQARLHGTTVFVPEGTFSYRSFSLDGVAMTGAGSNSILLAENARDSDIFLRGWRPALRNLSVTVPSSRRKDGHFAVFIDGARDFVVRSVTVTGGNAGGIFNYGGFDGLIIKNHVSDTLADAIHNTHGAHDIVVFGNTVRHSGDDMIAVVSYKGEPLCHNILIADNDVADQEYGRGISVVGGHDVTVQGNQVARTNCCAGIYIAAEKSWNTDDVQNILVKDNVLTDNSGTTGHGAIMIFAGQGTVSDIRIEQNTIVGARHAAVKLSGNVHNVAIIGNRFVDPAAGSITSNGPVAFCSDNMLNGSPVTAAPCSGQDDFVVVGSTLPLPE